MEEIKKILESDKMVYIYCRTGIERKLYHQWARLNGYVSKPSKKDYFCDVYLYRCTFCNKKGYKSGINYLLENNGHIYTEREYPSFLDKQSLRTLYDECNGRIYSYRVECDYCDNDINVDMDYPVSYVNQEEGETIISETSNCVLICKYDKITNERRKTEFDRRNYPYIGSGIDNLDDKLSQMDYCREYEIVPY